MTTGRTVAGHGDLDSIFDAYQGGTKPALTGHTVAGQDLRDRFSPRAEGDDIGFATGYAVRIDGQDVDLRELFAAKGSGSKPDTGVSYVLTASRAGMGGNQYTVSDGINFHADGTCDGASDWLTRTGAGKGARWQIRVDISDKYVAPNATLDVANDLASWTTMTSAQNVSAVLTSPPSTTASGFAMRVRIRRADTHEVVYDNTTSRQQNGFWVTLA